ncbi:MarR family winged helix-turn-helix transcriptional regulator, partial [Hyphomonas sp.]|uniref:MarR family winged helix-turn-helix transcriptional regulator n=1 Tax=Hyphomonas sp. TaxID=87 RepID=UPI00391C0223
MNPSAAPRDSVPAHASEQALIALRRILKAVDSHSRTLARDTSLTPSQLAVLKELAATGGAQPGDLARSAGLKQATISILLDRLQARGLVQRARGNTDRRTVFVQITPAGRETLS